MIALAFLFPKTGLFFTQTIIGAIVLAQILELTAFISRTNNDFARFINSVKDRDYTINLSGSEQTKSTQKLHDSFNQLAESLREMEINNAAQLHFLNQLVDQIEFGILVFDESDEVTLMNLRAQELLQMPHVKAWKNIKNPSIKLIESILNLPEAQNQLVEFRIDGQDNYFSVNIISVKIRNEKIRISSFQNIRSEIQSKEIEAWHKLISILTHEIMNSVTPLVSLAKTIQMILTNEEGAVKTSLEIEEQNLLDVNEALLTIEERGEGLLKFVNNYRKLTRIPKPELKETPLKSLIEGVLKLMSSELNRVNISVNLREFDQTLILDKPLIEQVLINVVKNAIEAQENNFAERIIDISSANESNQFRINVKDNGKGIPEDKLASIFVPFFTTKTDGSGIGLSLSREIMNLHGGYLEAYSDSEQTCFSLIFPESLLVAF